MPKAYDLQRLTVTHSPTQRVDLNYAKLPIPNPLDPGPFIHKLLQSIKDETGIDLTGFETFLDGLLDQNWFVDLLALLGNPNLGTDPFDVFESATNWIQSVLAQTGKVLTEWNLTGLLDDGLTLPFDLPAELGTATPDTPLQRFIDNLRIFLGADYTDTAFDIIQAVEDFITTHLVPSGLLALVTDLQELIDTIWQSITGTSSTNNPLTSLFAALQNIPFLNILGVGGPINIGASITSTWDQFVGGLVGLPGIGAGLADLFNVAQDISSRASLGMFSWDILGIRNNKSLLTGFLPTSESNIGYGAVALGGTTMPTVAVTQSTALTAYQRISEAADKAAVSFQGYTTGTITNAFVNIFKMNTATGLSELVHTSVDIASLLSPTLNYVIYDLPTSIPVAASEAYGVELAVVGSGTFHIVGTQTGSPNHPTVFPRNWASVRNSGTSAAPATIAHSALTYSTNVPFVEFAVSSGDPGVPHAPQLEYYGTAGTPPGRLVPLWANTVQVIAFGPGGGGRQGGAFGFSGEGGGAGSVVTATWVRGTDFTGSPIITMTVGAGGGGGYIGIGYGGNGGNTTVTIPGHTITATGGIGGTALTFGSGNLYGRSPGNVTYDGILYAGGAAQYASGSPGAPPGGGGSAGDDILYQYGGNGASGAVWLRFTT